MWVAETTRHAQQRELVDQMQAAIVEEYRELIAQAVALRDADARARRRQLAALRRQLQAIRRRDYFPPRERDEALQAVQDLADLDPTATTTTERPSA